jgi:hypothetical protein
VQDVRPLTVLRAIAAGAALALAVTACGSAGPASPGQSAPASPGQSGPADGRSPGARAGRIPAPAHTVVVVMENHSYGEIIASPAAPFINSLARQGALFTSSNAVTHPSQPNYLDLFAGSDFGITDDSCPHTLQAPNLGAGLIAAHLTFAGYSQDLPPAGSAVCQAGEYARKHVPWANFSNVPASASQPYTAFGAGGYQGLPTVSFVIPNLCNDMHDCSVATGDSWLRQHISGYAQWAMSHRSLLILTWDEGSGDNHIVTIFAGQQVKPGRYPQLLTHFGVLRTIEDAYRLPHDGAAATATPLIDIWK